MSTFSRSATSAALRSGRTLKPMMIAFDAEASSTSDSLMAPTPAWMIRILTFSSDSLVSVSASTSAEPCTSALMMIGSSLTSPSAICCLQRLERQARRLRAPSAFSFACVWRNSATWRALAASAIAWNVSPGCGSAARPSTSTGVDGPAALTVPAAVVDERAHLADDRPGDDRVADVQRAVLHEDRGHRPAALVELGLEHRARRPRASGWPSARRCR